MDTNFCLSNCYTRQYKLFKLCCGFSLIKNQKLIFHIYIKIYNVTKLNRN